MTDFSIPIYVRERAGIPRTAEAIRLGVPVGKGTIFKSGEARAVDPSGRRIPMQGRVLARWPDRSIKWLLVDALVTIGAGETAVIRICGEGSPEEGSTPALTPIALQSEDNFFLVDAGAATFRVARGGQFNLASAAIDGKELLREPGLHLELTTRMGETGLPTIRSTLIEAQGPLRVTLIQECSFQGRGPKFPLRLVARSTFTAGSAAVRLDIKLTNPQAAQHPGGLWDLGDPGSWFFRDVSIVIPVVGNAISLRWYGEDPAAVQGTDPTDLTIYQDSSGGEHWDSVNHIDWLGEPSVAFRGYQVWRAEGQLLASGMRATPSLEVVTERSWVCATVQDFWQNFPKALRWKDGALRIGLFPGESRGAFELQGGEQKRHVVFLDFGGEGQISCIPALQSPLHAWIDPRWVARTGVLPFLTADDDASDARCRRYVRNIIEGPNSFFAKREVIDEYGWRNFGDLNADHEAVNHRGRECFISHYNNQYDFVFGAAIQYLRSGDSRWHELMDRAARHTVDIDIYHSDEDKAAYAHGHFWHTDHYRQAGTCTHRTYSRRNAGKGNGGGPSNEHNYTSGLLLHHYLTGDPESAAAVRELAGWVLRMDDGSQTVLGLIDEGPTGAATQTRDTDYHKPGRGAGNSINALIDAYVLKGERPYLAKAEEFIRRCIHPQDGIGALALDDPESRWSYLVFLQVLGKYLALKSELEERDYWYCYAQDSLAHYAEWMLEHEVPYKDVLHKVQIPTETWPAQDIRKCCVFHLAAHFSPPARADAFRERARFFFDRCLDDVLSFDTAHLTRPLVIVCANGYAHDYFAATPAAGPGFLAHGYSFGEPELFLPQRARWKATANRKASIVLGAIRRAIAGLLARHTAPRSRGR